VDVPLGNTPTTPPGATASRLQRHRQRMLNAPYRPSMLSSGMKIGFDHDDRHLGSQQE
jgi:hypothetical protein